MENEKEYKYKVMTDDNLVVTKRIPADTGRQNQGVYRNKRDGIWKPNLGIRRKDFKATKHSAAMYGEYIASLLCKKIGFQACDVEMLKRNIELPYSKSRRTVEVPGVISYIDLDVSKGEQLIQAISLLAWYKSEHNDEYIKIMNQSKEDSEKLEYCFSINNSSNNNNIELIIPAFEAYLREKGNASEEQIAKMRQDLINMVVFDCRFGNPDRNDENYGLKVSKYGVSLYPLFDNERILGFAEAVEDIEKYSGARLQEHIDTDITSRMGISSQVEKLRLSSNAYIFIYNLS